MTQVTHARFGTGTIIAQDDATIQINFNGEVKVLVAKFAKLTNLDGTPYGNIQEEISKPKRKTRHEKAIAQRKRWNSLTAEQKAKENAAHARFVSNIELAELNDKYLPCQVARMRNA